MLGFFTPAIGEVVLFFASLLFFLMGRRDIRRGIVLLFDHAGARLLSIRILNDIERVLTRYIAAVTVINLGVASVTGIGLYFIGLPNAISWALLTFMMAYLPYVGPAIMLVLFFVIGLLSLPSLSAAFIAPAFYLGVTTIEGQFVTPNILGRQFEMSPFLVFLAIVFWTWLWGPVGAFIAVPLSIAGIVAVRHFAPDDEIDLPG
jgi:predicted PurR-regulated permease PerM